MAQWVAASSVVKAIFATWTPMRPQSLPNLLTITANHLESAEEKVRALQLLVHQTRRVVVNASTVKEKMYR